MFCRKLLNPVCVCTILLLCRTSFGQETPTTVENVPIHLQVDAGTPLRLYATSRVGYRKGKVFQARFAEPVWAFDRIVIPASTTVEGLVVALDPVPRMMRAMAIVRGDFTPLKRAKVSFTKMVLPSGQSIDLNTEPGLGLESIFVPTRPAKVQKAKTVAKAAPKTPRDPNSRSAQVRSFLRQQAQAQASARSRGLLDFVRGPNRREWLESFLWAKLPYHPQWYRSGTRFDAVLANSIDFGSVSLPSRNLQEIGSAPATDTPAAVRLLSTINSGDARVGDPIAGVLSQPLFSADQKVVLPEGTRLTGKVTVSRPARMFHRGGQLRFTFDKVDVSAFAAREAPRPERVQAQLTAAEEASGNIKVDAEGTVKATESKTRFLRPLIAGLVAAKSMDDDAGKQGASGGANANFSGRGLGGFSGFGLLGTAAARGPQAIGAALGYYGLAWSVYSTIVSRGQEVTFQKNAAMAIRFGAPAKAR